MTFIVPWWFPPAIVIIGGFIGWAICTLIYHWPENPRAGESSQPRRSVSSQLPRPGYLTYTGPLLEPVVHEPPADAWDTPPMGFWSAHKAQLDAHEREIYQYITQNPYHPS